MLKIIITILCYFSSIAVNTISLIYLPGLYQIVFILQGIIIGKLMLRHNNQNSKKVPYISIILNIIGFFILHQFTVLNIPSRLQDTFFPIIISFILSIGNYNYWKQYIFNRIKPLLAKGVDKGIPLGKNILEKSKSIQEKVIDKGIPLGKNIMEKSKSIQEEAIDKGIPLGKKIIQYFVKFKLTKKNIIKISMLVMVSNLLIYPPYKNIYTGNPQGHHFSWKKSRLSNAANFSIDYKVLFFDYLIILIISSGLIYLNNSKNKK